MYTVGTAAHVCEIFCVSFCEIFCVSFCEKMSVCERASVSAGESTSAYVSGNHACLVLAARMYTKDSCALLACTSHQPHLCACRNGIVWSGSYSSSWGCVCLVRFSEEDENILRGLQAQVSLLFCKDSCARLACTSHQPNVCAYRNGIVWSRSYTSTEDVCVL